MQKALGNLFRSIAEVVDNGETSNGAAAVAVAVETPNAAESGMSDSAIEDGIIGLIEESDFTHRTATTLAEKLGVTDEKIIEVVENSDELHGYTKESSGEFLVRLS